MNCPFTEKHVVLTPWFLFSPYSIFKGDLCVSSNIADITHNLTFLCFLVEEKPAFKKESNTTTWVQKKISVENH